ncbi:MAG: hypothetical protein IK093_05965 [Ruminiclostridium sp.]|nr:hypothetical protein [Ruminiclostridium sp.]MBR5088955.1 hypothetical protein [Ruminiclostridium sp.]
MRAVLISYNNGIVVAKIEQYKKVWYGMYDDMAAKLAQDLYDAYNGADISTWDSDIDYDGKPESEYWHDDDKYSPGCGYIIYDKGSLTVENADSQLTDMMIELARLMGEDRAK